MVFQITSNAEQDDQGGSLPIALILRFCKQRSITTPDLIALPEQWDKEFEWHNLKRANSYHDKMK